MGNLENKEKKILHPVSDDPGVFLWWCPGCEETHGVWTDAPNASNGAKWTFNGNLEKPTFSPSLKVTGVLPLTKAQIQAYENGTPLPTPTPLVCHTFIKSGKIEYLTDCTHKLAGQTIDMQPF